MPVPCPHHQTAERTRHVPALFADVYAGDVAGLLSPRPALKAGDRIAWAGTALGVAGMILVWAGAAVGDGAFRPAFWCGMAAFAGALALYGWAAARRARAARVARGIPAALALWRRAWYCERCDGVFFDGVSLGGEGLLSASEFRRLVWSEGGYADLLSR